VAEGKAGSEQGDLIAEHDEERPSRRLSRRLDRAVAVAAFLVAVLVLRQVFDPFAQGNQFYLVIFLGLTLPLAMICYRPELRRKPPGEGRRDDPGVSDWVLAGLALLCGLYPVLPIALGESGGGFDAFLNRQGALSPVDIAAGAVLLALILEACRRTTGPVLPGFCLAFLAFAYYGGRLPQDWAIAHAGIDFSQIINALYNDASGFYGTPLDVAATYIVLFTIYGAVLDASGAGKFFVDFSFAVFRNSSSAPARTAALSGFLLGTVSGSSTATTVSLGAVTWPILRRAGYPKEKAGGLLAASGVGAILSPPTLGAAAFIIAEYLRTSYFEVLTWALLPTLLYYLGIALAVEADARRFGARAVPLDAPSPWTILRAGGYHFLSLAIIVVFLALAIPPFTAVVYATLAAALFALAGALAARRGRLGPTVRDWAKSMAGALAGGIRGALPVIAVCAAAGVITSTVTKTGLGQVLSSALVDAARALSFHELMILPLTVVFAAVGVGLLGLAVPVTASFIIAWVVLSPALAELGVAAPAIAMFLFYYAVLSEVTPPTALASVAAAAITGGRVMGTMWQTWRYTLPAFLVPIAFVATGEGSALLLLRPAPEVLWVAPAAALGVVALAALTTGWMVGPARWPERLLCGLAAALLLYIRPATTIAGVAAFACAVGVHLALRRKESNHAP